MVYFLLKMCEILGMVRDMGGGGVPCVIMIISIIIIIIIIIIVLAIIVVVLLLSRNCRCWWLCSQAAVELNIKLFMGVSISRRQSI